MGSRPGRIRRPGDAWLLSTPMIKGELRELLAQIAPGKKWYRRSTLAEMCAFVVGTVDPATEDAREQRALELAHVLWDRARG